MALLPRKQSTETLKRLASLFIISISDILLPTLYSYIKKSIFIL